jgi:uncharacterized membrane protein
MLIYPLCNKKPDRAPHLLGHTFLLCWRCTGLVAGALVGCLLLTFVQTLGLLGMLLLVPVGVDGVLQYKYGVLSNNYRRFITGFLGGLSVLSGI